MYKEYDEVKSINAKSVLALDWDETTSDYPLAFKHMATLFARVIIVTVNNELTSEHACKWLGRSPEDLQIFCCPDEHIDDVPGWKSDVCARENAALMFDDNPEVVRACHDKGVNAVCVSERAWKFEKLAGR